MDRFQKVALAALVSVLLLVFVGAIVRASGAGLGCPDWPTCWGRLIPPTSIEQIDFTALDLEKFRRHAERHGRDPAAVTRESLRSEFNPVHTWIEYVNRLCTIPVGVLTLGTFLFSLRQLRSRPAVTGCALAALLVVGVNAWLGAMVVRSGLRPGIITLHMALAILLLCLLVYVAWRGRDVPWRRKLPRPGGQAIWWAVGAIFALTVAEGVMGARVRELTDEFAKTYGTEARSAWTDKLEHSAVYLVHRSFSWLIVVGTAGFLILARKAMPGGLNWLDKGIVALVGALLAMGLVLAHVGVLQVVQVLHVGAAALLITALFFWLLATRPDRA